MQQPKAKRQNTKIGETYILKTEKEGTYQI